MPLVVTNPTHVPPGGAFIAKHPTSGAKFRHHTVDGVILKYNEHCRANHWPEANRQELVQNICANTPANICHEGTENAPSIWQMAGSLVGELASWAKQGFKVTTQEQLGERKAICEACPYWNGYAGGSLFGGRCGKCGCTSLKLGLATSSCPIGKWGPV